MPRGPAACVGTISRSLTAAICDACGSPRASASSLPLGTVLPTAKAARADPSITLGVYAHVISDQLTEAVRCACQAYAVVQDLLYDA